LWTGSGLVDCGIHARTLSSFYQSFSGNKRQLISHPTEGDSELKDLQSWFDDSAHFSHVFRSFYFIETRPQTVQSSWIVESLETSTVVPMPIIEPPHKYIPDLKEPVNQIKSIKIDISQL